MTLPISCSASPRVVPTGMGNRIGREGGAFLPAAERGVRQRERAIGRDVARDDPAVLFGT